MSPFIEMPLYGLWCIVRLYKLFNNWESRDDLMTCLSAQNSCILLSFHLLQLRTRTDHFPAQLKAIPKFFDKIV